MPTPILMHSDPVHFPSSSPYTSRRATTTPKRRLQESPGTLRHCHPCCHPPPTHNSSVLSLHPEYSNDDMTLLRVSASESESSQNLRHSFYLAQLRRGSLHLEKHLIKQKIEEHEISLQALKERIVDVEKNIASTFETVINLHCYMDQVGVPIPDMPEHVAASIMISDSEDDDDAIDPQEQIFEDAATSEENEAAPGSWLRVQKVDADVRQ
ncbi:hypothetical protein EDB84DRAFT_1512274 [Lactarius hengduanensis]|nr:hypothetical protein EDB84DRAFT_1512274 [Lactarius hengduanensis]